MTTPSQPAARLAMASLRSQRNFALWWLCGPPRNSTLMTRLLHARCCWPFPAAWCRRPESQRTATPPACSYRGQRLVDELWQWPSRGHSPHAPHKQGIDADTQHLGLGRAQTHIVGALRLAAEIRALDEIRALGQLRSGAGEGQLALFQHVGTVGDGQRLPDELLDQEDRGAVGGDGGQHGEELLDDHRGEAEGELVDHQ